MPSDVDGKDFLKIKKDINIFIETGSEKGNGISSALKAGFDEIHSIELDEKFYNECVARYSGNNKVNLYLGDSLVVLPSILEKINSPFVLWLDAHWSMAGYKGEMMHDFLPKELDIIKQYKDKFENSLVIIDDMNHYQNNRFFCQIVETKVKELNPRYTLNYVESEGKQATHLVATL